MELGGITYSSLWISDNYWAAFTESIFTLPKLFIFILRFALNFEKCPPILGKLIYGFVFVFVVVLREKKNEKGVNALFQVS